MRALVAAEIASAAACKPQGETPVCQIAHKASDSSRNTGNCRFSPLHAKIFQ
jgi:hypothetical protein